MAFDLSGLFRGSHNTADVSYQKATKADVGNAVQSEGARQYAMTKELLNLSPGQTLQGEIMDVKGNEVQILIGKEFLLTARLDSGVKPAIGQLMSFEVKGNHGNMLALRPLQTNLSSDTSVLKALDAAGMPVNEDTAFMVSTLMKEGMPIDKQTLFDTYKTMIQNPDVSPLTLVQMNRLHIPITPENITQFEQYKNYEHQISASVDVIADSIPTEMLSQLNQNELPQAMGFISNMLDSLTQAGGQESVSLAQVLPDTEARAQLADLLSQAGASPEQVAQIKNGEMSLQDVLAIVKEFAEKEAEMIQNSTKVFTEGQNQTDKGFAQMQKQNQTGNATSDIPGGDVANTETANQQVGQNTASLTGREAMVKETLHAILNSKEFSHILKSEIHNQFLLHPQDVKNGDKIEEFYTKLREQTNRLTNVLSKAAQADSTLAKTVENVRDNIDFMHQLNQAFAYVQLPLKMSGNSTHGELYVYANKRNLAKKEGNVSALLHLDMEHLGMVDVYVQLQNEKLSTKFYLETDELLDFIESNLHILNERLQKRGYNVATEAVVRENRKTNVMEEILKQDKNVSLLSTQSFDVRA
ncbi:MAG: flagellar hook-length control protein FliK [Lachnospiraceae bacterium]|nr:flagellar hook-length control protein FliK [Lachnospiraceae bacterium]